jgi:WD40 repeat protein
MNRHRCCLGCLLLFLGVMTCAADGQTRPAVTALALTADGKSYLSGSQAGVFCRSLIGSDEGTIPVKLDHVLALAFSPEGARLAIAGGSPAESGAVEIMSWPGRKLLGRLDGHEDVVTDVCWLADGKTLATSSADRTIRVWDAADGKCLTTLRGHSGPVLALAVSPDGKWLCSGSADQTIRVWNTATRQLARSLDNHLGAVHSLAYRPPAENPHHYLASASTDGTVRVWQPAIGRMVRIVRLQSPIHAVVWNRAGDRLHAGGKDGILRTIDADSDEIIHQENLSQGAITVLAVGDGGRIHAGTSRGDVRMAGK